MHEDLVGYLLGALDADEQSRLEAELAKNPQLRLQLE
jgi:anti-sigma factor RsiW